MDGAGDQFLTSSSLSTNKNTRIGGSNFHKPRKHSLKRRRGDDDLFEHERLVDLLPEHYVFVVQLISQTLNLFKRFLQFNPGLRLFGDIQCCPVPLDEVTHCELLPTGFALLEI